MSSCHCMLTLFLLVILKTVSIRGESIVSLETGTGFRTCTGYCYNSIYVNATTLVTLQTSKSDPVDYPDRERSHSFQPSEFNQLVELVGNLQVWKAVDSPIGCPDCNDQGLEWITVYSDTQPAYSVIFEYNTSIPDYESLVNSLRTLRKQYFPATGTSN